nr:MAG TPA: hypothetical protein [Caudoviricetes sp.]
MVYRPTTYLHPAQARLLHCGSAALSITADRRVFSCSAASCSLSLRFSSRRSFNSLLAINIPTSIKHIPPDCQ